MNNLKMNKQGFFGRPTILVDVDDVAWEFNGLAIKLANEERNYNPPLTLEDITSWANTGRASVIKEYYNDERLYKKQAAEGMKKETKAALLELMEIADVYFCTAVYPEYMGLRAKLITDEFPDLPKDRIILGAAKHMVHADIILDDNICNVLNSPAQFPVLMRRPWNTEMTGLLSVNNMQEFLILVKYMMAMGKGAIEYPSVIALVGPSGSGKTAVLNELTKNAKFEKPVSYTTNPHNKWKVLVDEDTFRTTEFLEKTRYGGYGYGTKAEDIKAVLDAGKCAVIPLDMCGAIGLQKVFPVITVYISNRKMDCISNIIADKNLSDNEKTLRIMSLDAERKNETLCDFSVEKENAVELISDLL